MIESQVTVAVEEVEVALMLVGVARGIILLEAIEGAEVALPLDPFATTVKV